MRLVIDGRRLTAERTGVGRYLELLLAEWAESGLPCAETIVVLKDTTGRDRVPVTDGLRPVVIGERWPGLAWERLGLGRVLQPGDLLFAPTNLIPSNWAGPTVLVLFDLIQEVLPEGFSWHVRQRFGWRYRRAARKAQTILVPSYATARDLVHIYEVEPGRIRVIPPGIDPGFRPRAPDSAEVRDARRAVELGDDPFFLFVGKRSARRNVRVIVEAFREHSRAYPKHRLIFVGPDDDRDALTGQPGIHQAGHVSDTTLHGLLAGATALLYPSEYEGFGLPVAEALASGCPAITLRNSALPEAGGAAAIYLDAATPEAIASAMRTIIDDRVERTRRVELGLAHAAQFGRDRFAAAVRSLLVDRMRGLGTRRLDGGTTAARVERWRSIKLK